MRQEILDHMNERLSEIRAQNSVFDTCLSVIMNFEDSFVDSTTELIPASPTSYSINMILADNTGTLDITINLVESLYDGSVTVSINCHNTETSATSRLATFTTTSTEQIQENYFNILDPNVHATIVKIFSALYTAIRQDPESES